MDKSNFRGIMLMIIFIWAGMLLGISFLEAPLKFHAPNITLALGVGIGRLVFGTLNKVELVYCLSLIILSLITNPPKWFYYLGTLVVFLLLVQTFWILPALDARAEIIINGGVPSQPSPHLYYVAAEVIKLISLITLGLKFFSETIKAKQNG